eukprot:7383358-Prymnesium_polylepis.1
MKAVLMLALKPGVHDVSLVVDVVVEVVTLVVVVVVELAGDEYETTADSTPSTADRRGGDALGGGAHVLCGGGGDRAELMVGRSTAVLGMGQCARAPVAVTSVLNA